MCMEATKNDDAQGVEIVRRGEKEGGFMNVSYHSLHRFFVI